MYKNVDFKSCYLGSNYNFCSNRLLGSTEFDFKSVENNTNPMTRRIKEVRCTK